MAQVLLLPGRYILPFLSNILLMKKAVLIFPEVTSMAEFILSHKISRAQSNSVDLTLTAVMTEQQIATARKQYKARVKSSITVARKAG